MRGLVGVLLEGEQGRLAARREQVLGVEVTAVTAVQLCKWTVRVAGVVGEDGVVRCVGRTLPGHWKCRYCGKSVSESRF